MTTPATIDFSFKWAYITSSNTVMQHTSTNYIPIWNYAKLKKIVVANTIDTRSTFILFDKARGAINPDISTVSSIDLKNELFKFVNLLASGTATSRLYGQAYHSYMDYIRIKNDRLETEWVNWPDRAFYVTYTYDFFEYDTTKKNELPLQFLFKDYNFTPSSVANYKTMGYTAEELIKAGLKFGQLSNGGYNITDDLFPVLCKLYSDIDVQFINAMNTLKTSNATLTTSNATLTTSNATLTAEKNALTNTNGILTINNEILTTENKALTNTNGILTTENNELKSMNTTITTFNATLIAEKNELTNTNGILTIENDALKKNTNTKLTTENNSLKSTNITLTTQINALTKNNNTLKNRDTTLTTEMNALQNTNTTLATEMNALKNTNTTLTTQMTALTKNNNTLKNTNITLTKNNNELKNTNATLTTNNNVLKNTNTILTTENNTLKKTIASSIKKQPNNI